VKSMLILGMFRAWLRAYFMCEGFGVSWYRYSFGLYGYLLDTQPDVYYLALASLRHHHTAERVVICKVVSNHGLEELFWGHVVR
jgi:hypothetical protein